MPRGFIVSWWSCFSMLMLGELPSESEPLATCWRAKKDSPSLLWMLRRLFCCEFGDNLAWGLLLLLLFRWCWPGDICYLWLAMFMFWSLLSLLTNPPAQSTTPFLRKTTVESLIGSVSFWMPRGELTDLGDWRGFCWLLDMSWPGSPSMLCYFMSMQLFACLCCCCCCGCWWSDDELWTCCSSKSICLIV